ncbi:DUF2897 family protein [Vibrio caribbeanicus]|uniref:DUF2897 family protein n=1 Tax=Vibrio caribbeanicus TaxID=701175 RepID=UPI0030DAE5C7
MDLLTNPWVIIVIVLSVIIGNIMALKYTAKMKFEHKTKKTSSDKTTEEKQERTDKDSEDG